MEKNPKKEPQLNKEKEQNECTTSFITKFIRNGQDINPSHAKKNGLWKVDISSQKSYAVLSFMFSEYQEKSKFISISKRWTLIIKGIAIKSIIKIVYTCIHLYRKLRNSFLAATHLRRNFARFVKKWLQLHRT